MSRPEIEITENPLAFIQAGDALFTLQGATSRFTYRVSEKDGDPDLTFVSVLSGPDNARDYSCIGTLRGPSKALAHTKRVTPTTPSFKAFQWVYERLLRSLPIAPVRFYHHGVCGRCGRTLTTPESITRGFGPECIGKL